jgi:hypothetical protein
MYLLMLPQSENSNWHQPGERGVINALLTIQDKMLIRDRRLAEQISAVAVDAVPSEQVYQR